MQHHIIAIIVIAILLLIAITCFLYSVFMGSSDDIIGGIHETAVEIPEEAVEVADNKLPGMWESSDFFGGEADTGEVLDNTDIRQMSLRLSAPRLFRDDWYDITLREFSLWAVNLRREYNLAS